MTSTAGATAAAASAGAATGPGAAAGTGAASSNTLPPPLLTPIIFCHPLEGSSLTLQPIAAALALSTATADDSPNSIPPALLPIANRPLIAFILQQIVSAGLRYAIISTPSAQHSLFAHTLRQLHLRPPTVSSPTAPTSPNVQVLIDPLPGTSRRPNPSTHDYVLRIDLVPLGPVDRSDKVVKSNATTTAEEPTKEQRGEASKPSSSKPLGSAQLLHWLSSEGWLESDPLILPFDLLTPSLPLTHLIRQHQIATASLTPALFCESSPSGQRPSFTASTHSISGLPTSSSSTPKLGATTLLIERRTLDNIPHCSTHKATASDAVSKDRLKAERKAILPKDEPSSALLNNYFGDRLVVYSKDSFVNVVASPSSSQQFLGSAPSVRPETTAAALSPFPADSLIAPAYTTSHALLFSTALTRATTQSGSSTSAAFTLPPSIGRSYTAAARGGSTGIHVDSVRVSTSLVDSGIYILRLSAITHLWKHVSFQSAPPSKIRSIPHLVSLLARASSDPVYARKLTGANADAGAEVFVHTLIARISPVHTDHHHDLPGTGAASEVHGNGPGVERFLERVDTPSKYLEANRFLLRALSAPVPSALFPIPTLSEVGTLGAAPPLPSDSSAQQQQQQQQKPQITPDALIASSPSVSLGDRCVIRRSVIGKGCNIARGAKILGCVLMPGVTVGENAKLESTVLAPYTVVGARVTLLDVDAGPEGVKIADGTEAKLTRIGPPRAAATGAGKGRDKGAKGAGGGEEGRQALGFDASAPISGLVDLDSDSEDDEEDEEGQEEDE